MAHGLTMLYQCHHCGGDAMTPAALFEHRGGRVYCWCQPCWQKECERRVAALGPRPAARVEDLYG